MVGNHWKDLSGIICFSFQEIILAVTWKCCVIALIQERNDSGMEPGGRGEGGEVIK